MIFKNLFGKIKNKLERPRPEAKKKTDNVEKSKAKEKNKPTGGSKIRYGGESTTWVKRVKKRRKRNKMADYTRKGQRVKIQKMAQAATRKKKAKRQKRKRSVSSGLPHHQS